MAVASLLLGVSGRTRVYLLSVAIFFCLLLGSDGARTTRNVPRSLTNLRQLLGTAGKDVDGSNAVMAEFSAIVQKANLHMRKAQAHHAKTIKIVLGQLKQNLDAEADKLAEAVRDLGAELAKEAHLAEPVTSARRALADTNVTASAEGGVAAVDTARITLAAQLSVAEQAIDHASLRNQRRIHEARLRGDEQIEDSTGRLSHRVGDLSELVARASERLDAIERPASLEAASVGVTKEGVTTEPIVTARNTTVAVSVAAGPTTPFLAKKNFTKLGEALQRVPHQIVAAGTAAQKKFDDAFAMIQKDALANLKSVEAILDAERPR
eukprot:TRINITY_DN818_c0_g1_i3.p1 TRINITY_DN818_c0_g1~~TRINITY_DN818_c0_g1_i3.p1  ORF type:complete len:351 (-),score=63.07 TRINITY_DN818_c0_g1_i3:170-1138(-)